jgi:hypothetical protein
MTISIMNIMNRRLNKWLIIWLEIGMFGLVLATLWLDEYIDLPCRLFNAAPTPYRIEEYLIETTSVTIVGIIIIMLTAVALKRLERIEEYVRVCSWCKRVSLDDRWIKFEEYLLQKQDLRSTHGICESCAQKMKMEIDK